MLPSYEDIEESIRRWVTALVSVPCVPGNANAQPPSGLYSTLLRVSDTQTGMAVDGSNNGSITDHMLSYSLQFYGEGAGEKAADLRALAESQDGPDTTDFAYFRSSPVQRLDSVISADWQERAFTTLDVYARRRITVATPSIQHANLNIAVGDATDTVEIGV